MDSSFVTTMGMSGWGDEQNSQANSTTAQGDTDRLQMPCLIADLLNMSSSEEKISYGSYTFSTIRVVGQIVNITETENHELHYEITDPDDETVDGQTVRGTIYAQARTGSYSEGDWMVAFAKMRSFDGVLNLLTFAVRPADLADVRLLKAQARCAKFYYRDNAPEKILNGVVPEYIGTPLTNEPLGNQGKTEPMDTQQFGAPFNIPNSFPTRPQLSAINTGAKVKDEANSGNFNGTRGQIVDFFQQHRNSMPKNGFHMEDVKRELGNPPNFDNDMYYLLNEGILFNTHDSTHFTMI
ncbi:Replication protein A 32 kDa subunit [Aphelenchoides besseyi]|nr:Replication protein A 32 kDa subunit [Aphelenchoides besseyi]